MNLFSKQFVFKAARRSYLVLRSFKKRPQHVLAESTLEQLKKNNLYKEDNPLKLHLGCGRSNFSGYINIDYPAVQHDYFNTAPDFEADIMELNFPEESVDEIRLHHVFEHFNRVEAIAMLIRWSKWLKVGGVLHIETPDLNGSIDTLRSDKSFEIKMGVIRHLTGDQAEFWAFHKDLWFAERFEKTLTAMGFNQIEIKTWNWEKEPFLSNINVLAKKYLKFNYEKQFNSGLTLLDDSLIGPDKEVKKSYFNQLKSFRI
ncbi:MAG: Methylase involved in ubiquinone/menaquinone biosynthesis-like protein [candidate division TM6 bacterium GW2011_GWF2_32_72]|nr:MAG: Methylase involved in ubiquinone/menaquinone biosynthesis-like protein [candidate division TM6 bacterium GW2011_GWF2_32_72]